MKDSVLVTGASSGLGAHLAKKFHLEGHEVLHHGGRKHYDLANTEQIAKLAIEAKKFNVKILINNAAIVCPNINFVLYDIEKITKMIDVNLKAPILLSHMLLGQLTDMININSMVGLEVKKPRTLYSATKWGLRGFSNSLKAEDTGLNILDVYPTNIKTTPDRLNAMDVEMVVDRIYDAYLRREKELILDGRKG